MNGSKKRLDRLSYQQYRFGAILLAFAAMMLACRFLAPAPDRDPTPTIFLSATPIRIDTPTLEPYPLPVAPAPTKSPPTTATTTSTAMRTATLTPTLTQTVVLLPLSCLPTQAADQYGLVKWVEDGESIMVDIRGGLYSIHYLGIQAPSYLPEIAYYGPPAATQNAVLTVGRVVRLVSDGDDKDEQGRLLRYVIEGSDTFVNFELIRHGFARTAPDANQLACGEIFQQAESYAHQDQLGLWSPTRTRAPTRTPTMTRTGTPPTQTRSPGSSTPSATTSLIASPSPTLTVSSTVTPSPTPSGTISVTASITPTGTLTITVSPSVTGSPEASSTITLTPTP